jgi:hypothetical protein
MPGQMPNDNGQVGQPTPLPPAPPPTPGGAPTIGNLPEVQDIPQMTEGGLPMDMEQADTDTFVDEVERSQHLVVQRVDLVPMAAIDKASSPNSMIGESSAAESSPEGSVYYTPTPAARQIVMGTPSKAPRIDQTLINQTAAHMGASMARPEESNEPSSSRDSFQTPQTGPLTPVQRKSIKQLKTHLSQIQTIEKAMANTPERFKAQKEATKQKHLKEANALYEGLRAMGLAVHELLTTGEINVLSPQGTSYGRGQRRRQGKERAE